MYVGKGVIFVVVDVYFIKVVHLRWAILADFLLGKILQWSSGCNMDKMMMNSLRRKKHHGKGQQHQHHVKHVSEGCYSR